MSDAQSLASLRLLVAVAKADGQLHPEERRSLETALADLTLPAGTTIDGLLGEDPDVEAQLRALTDPAVRESAWQSMYTMAWADGDCVPVEQVILDRAREAFEISEERQTLLHRLVTEAKDTVLPSNLRRIDDPDKRAAEIREDTIKYATLAAVLGAFPVPGLALLTDLAVIGVQAKLVRDIGQYHGHTVDQAAAKSLLAAVGLGSGARIAVSNLAKLVPGWGAVVGAASSYAATWALGRVANRYFEAGAQDDPRVFLDAFRSAEKEGKAEYETRKAQIEASREANAAELNRLFDEVKAGKISQADYQKRVLELR